MRKLRILALAAALVLTVALLIPTAAFAGDEESSGPVVSEAIDALKLAGTQMGGPSAHGNNQTRIVTTSTASYLGVLTGQTEDQFGLHYSAAMIRVKPNGECTLLKEVIVDGTSTTATIMADKDENVWLYSGWDTGGGHFQTNLWCYRVATDTVEEYLYDNFISRGNGWGYSVACMDQGMNKIYAIAGGGDAPSGYFAWGEFDIATCQWSRMLSKKVSCRYCYHYAYPDGNGGFFVVDERDITVYASFTDIEGMRVSEALQTYHSRSFDANYMWDDPTLIHVPDVTKSEVVLYQLEPDGYDVMKGLYPNCNNGRNDVMVIGHYVYILISMTDSGVPGTTYKLHILDMDKNFEEISVTEVPRLYGPSENYNNRFFLDTAGNLYLFEQRAGGAKMEIWKGEGELKNQFRLMAELDIEPFASQGKGYGAFIMSSSRGGAVPSDVASFILDGGNTWNFVTVDLSCYK
ncbi:MAG: hypothetical protein II797_00105 [Clostridia bacterium]|nr:hypothetical protein [Clostridia bacterium]